MREVHGDRAASPAGTVPTLPQAQLRVVLFALILAVLLATLDTTIVTTALPTIAGEFNAFEHYAWVGTAYIVASTIATPILGKLSDLLGRRVVFQATMATFLLGSLACGIAQSMNQLIAARALQGLGGGAIQALAFSILGDILTPRERGRYIGYFTMAFAGAALAGPLVGGFIIDHWSWHWIFLINLPLCVLVGALTHRALRLPFPRRAARVDWAGAALLSIGLGCGMIGLEEGRTGWTEPLILLLFAGAGVSLVVFVLRQRVAPEPMIPLRLFANPVVLTCCLLGMLAGSVSYGWTQFLPIYFQDAMFVSPTGSGLRMLPIMVAVVIASFSAGRLVARTGRYKVFPLVGSALSAVGLALSGALIGASAYWHLVAPLALIGFGSGFVFTTTSIALQNGVEFRDLGIGTATMMFFRSLGGSIGLAVAGTLLNSSIRADLPERTGLAPDAAVALIRAPKEIAALAEPTRQAVIDSIADGVGTLMWVAAGCMAVGVLVAAHLPELPLRTKAGITDALESAG